MKNRRQSVIPFTIEKIITVHIDILYNSRIDIDLPFLLLMGKPDERRPLRSAGGLWRLVLKSSSHVSFVAA